MRGHTNNRILRASLNSLIKRSQEEVNRRSKPEEKSDLDYFLGKIDAAKELLILHDLGE